MKLNIDDLAVTTFSIDAGAEDDAEAHSHTCPQSYNTLCLRTCVTCYAGCETGQGGAC